MFQNVMNVHRDFYVICEYSKMYLVIYLVLASLVFESHAITKNKSSLCSTWNVIEQSLKNKDLHITCVKDEDCQSLNCSRTDHGYYVNCRIQFYACENPPSIEIEVNIPKMNVNNIKMKIHHNDSVPLTSNLCLEFEIQRTNQEFALSIFVHYLNNGSFPLLHIPVKVPIINHIGFPVNCPSIAVNTEQSVDMSKSISVTSSPKTILMLPKGTADDYSNCSIVESSCRKNEICQQTIKTNPDGICVCISSYKRDKTGKCVYDPALFTSTEGPDHNPVKPDKKETSNVSLLLTAILVPISVIVLFVILVYASIRFRIFQHLRRRLRVQVYEHVLLGEEEEEDLTNPVA